MGLSDKIVQGGGEGYFIPSINFSASTGICRVEGESFLEDTRTFYTDLMTWCKQYFEEGNASMEVHFKLLYFNSTSSKWMLRFMIELAELVNQGKDVKIVWHSPSFDQGHILEEGQGFEEDCGLEFTFEEYDK